MRTDPPVYTKLITLLVKIREFGDKLPHPTALFFYLCLLMLLLSALASALGWQATHPTTNHLLTAKSLISLQGITFFLTDTVKNFMNFAPLGPVLIAMLGIGLAERSGFLSHLVKGLTTTTKNNWLSYSIVLGGVLSNLAADAGYVVYIPLCALLFKSVGRHPIAGIAAAFAGVSGGYSANIFIGPVDVILSGLSQDAARQIAPAFTMLPTSNYFFLLASTALITGVGGFVTNNIIEPFLNAQHPYASPSTNAKTNTEYNRHGVANNQTASPPVSEYKAIRFALLSIFVFLCVILLIALPANSPLRDVQTGSLLTTPLIQNIVILIALAFALAGMVYGKITGAFKNSHDWVLALEKTFATLAGYLVLMFFAAQFVAWFNWTQLGPIFAIKGAQWLQGTNAPPALLLVSIIFITALLNLFVGSASAKWGLLAPILVPMMLILGVQPEWVQMAYRIGDSSSNIITPLMPYFALVLAYAQQEDRHIQLGGLIAIMLPYSIAFLILWTSVFLLWRIMDLPLGV
jgi:aminobenzoyl-glutamate transport protein